jgi:Uma2 family endonuclease
MQTTIADLAIPDVKPAIELYRGTFRQKVSPQFTHALLQSRLLRIVAAWAAGRGRAGTEWRFSFLEAGLATSSSLVPDVAYVSFDRLPYDASLEAEQPLIAPDIAIEVLSPDDRPGHVREKIDLYRAYGASCVVIVDPKRNALDVYDAGTNGFRTAHEPASITILDELTIDLGALFAPLEPPNPR